MIDQDIIDELKETVDICFEVMIPRRDGSIFPSNYNLNKILRMNIYVGYEGNLRFRILKNRYGEEVKNGREMKILQSLFPSIVTGYDHFTINAHDLALLKLFWS